ncbi:MAG: radical SAM protein [Candidatus Methanoplasma sp.]|jgi:uncharacterized radical SAM superfamily protein|nr:radical SAM protein [Candidatus Methanoplasma sp.]
MANDGSKLTDYRPGALFPSVSVTGSRCDEMCGHCKGIHLKHMVPATTDEQILRTAENIKNSGGKGILLSGGCDVHGTVPLISFLETIGKIVGMGLEVNVHAGFLTEDEASKLVDAGVKDFSVDVHQDPDVIRSVLNLDRRPEDYRDLLRIIMDAGGHPMPHITAGFGTADLYYSAQLIRDLGISEVVLLTLVPTKGTEFEEPSITEAAILDAVDTVRNMGLDVILGCMRDRSLRTLEIGCIEHGVRKIANMSRSTLKWAEENGFEIITDNRCCLMG